MAETEGESSQVLRVSCADKENLGSYEPCQKKAKLSDLSCDYANRLEDRLNGILCCAVCLDLPQTCYQCTNGHLMCASCFNHLLADARIRDETATCPNCRCEINKNNCVRNLAVEKAATEMPVDCHLCSLRLPRHQMSNHQRHLCPERPMACRYARIGCRWKGPHQALAEHESSCILPSKNGVEIMDALEALDMRQAEEQKLYKTIFSLLSFEKITFNDLQLKPYRTDDFITQLFYESSRFTTFGYQWSVRATLNSGESKNPSHSIRRSMQYQLSLKSNAPANPIRLHFLILKGPYGEMRINPIIYEHEFSGKEPDSGFKELPLIDSTECNKILAMKTINLRVILFHVTS
ncbi:zinc finger TRAF-type-containing protein 1-B-like [Babylonia areolata]|uniref:zinc finger TRAF-type-containing protein 1-B-like n=1 Tax=Babylonia areolata TaxID=304850 RepID=UPI003FD6702A